MNGLPPAVERALGILARTPGRLQELVTDLDEAAWRTKPAADRFSVLESVAHLRDIDSEGFSRRVRRILEEDSPFLPDVDGAALARERRYNEEPTAPALAAFLAGRRRSLDLLQGAGETAFRRKGQLEGVGFLTLGELLDRWIAHDEEHLREVESLVAPAGRP
jgi:hypothetical protein